MKTETWLPVVGYEGFYQVSSQGQVRSLPRLFTYRTGTQIIRPGRMLRPISLPRTGHLRVQLSRNQGEELGRYLIHRLMLIAFVGPPEAQQEACHGDDNPINNVLSNLRWDTRKANVADAIKNGRNHNLQKTHCKHGHSFSIENTYHRPDGGRQCRRCKANMDSRRQKRLTTERKAQQ